MLIKQVFQNHLSELRVDHQLLKKIIRMEEGFVNKRPENIEFFGGALTGVQVVRFTQEDRDKLFNDILNIDDTVLQEDLYGLIKDERTGEKVLHEDRKVSSDIFNLSCMYLIHAAHNSRYLSDKEIQECKVRVCIYMFYRFLTSLMFNYFRYPADREVAQAAYELLSGKFIIKQTGSWSATLRYFAENAVSTTGIHRDVITKMPTDEGVINFLNDTQGRIRDTMKNITRDFLKVHEQGIRIVRNSSMVEIDGEIVLKDRTKSLVNYTRYLKTIIPDRNSFIKQELIDVVCNMMQTMPEKLLILSLEYVSANYGHTNDNLVEDAVDSVMDHAFDYLSQNKQLLHNRADIGNLISKVRGTYMSSRATDEMLVTAREDVRRVVVNATKSKNDSVVAATRTGLAIYLLLRAITMKHYST